MQIKASAWTAVLACGAMVPLLSQAAVIVGVVAPPPVVAVAPVVPVPGYVWLPGYWAWTGVAYRWTPGRYVVAPRPGAVWVGGHWVARGGGWVWRGGYWRR